MYALLTADLSSIQKYPVTRADVARIANRMISAKTPITAILGNADRVVNIQPTTRPAESETYKVVEGTPVKNGQVWEQVWNTVQLDAGEQTAKLNKHKKALFKAVAAKGAALRSGKYTFGPGEFDLSGDGFTRIALYAAVPGARTVPIGPNKNGIERYHEATAQQVAALVAAVSGFIDATYARELALKDLILAADTVNDINAIDISSGWPDPL